MDTFEGTGPVARSTPFAIGSCPETTMRFPVRTAGTYAATGFGAAGRVIPRWARAACGFDMICSGRGGDCLSPGRRASSWPHSTERTSGRLAHRAGRDFSSDKFLFPEFRFDRNLTTSWLVLLCPCIHDGCGKSRGGVHLRSLFKPSCFLSLSALRRFPPQPPTSRSCVREGFTLCLVARYHATS